MKKSSASKSKVKKVKGISHITGKPIKVRYQFKFDRELIEELKVVAEKEHRPFNQYVEVLLKRHLKDMTGIDLPF